MLWREPTPHQATGKDSRHVATALQGAGADAGRSVSIEHAQLRTAVIAQEKLTAALAAERAALAERERLALRRLKVLRLRLERLDATGDDAGC